MSDWLRISGLIINAVGTVMVFWFAVPNRVKTSGVRFRVLEASDLKAAAKEKRSAVIGWIGLVMVLAGAVMQAFA